MHLPMSNVQRIEWDEVRKQATGVLGRYIRIDTSNPPGNEGLAARFLTDVLRSEGVDARCYESAPGRENVVARLKAAEGSATPGDGPLLLLHHMDVVPAQLSTWRFPPFDGVVQDGYVWGRGAIDDKGLGTIHLMAFILLKRLAIPLKRDVIFMAVADEEEGGHFGTRWMVQHHWADIECDYVWDEGGSGSQGIIGTHPIFAVAVSEKRSMVLRLTATDHGGHGAMAAGASIDHLARALVRLQGRAFEPRISAVTREFFRRVAGTQPFPVSWLLRNSGWGPAKALVGKRLDGSPTMHAMVRDTVTATVVRAGERSNVAPEVAEATLDARLLPDTDARGFVDRIRNTVGDGSVSVEALEYPESAPPSPSDSALFNALERGIEAHVPGAIVAPFLTPVATDSRFFRARGVKAYGLIPTVQTQLELNTVHGPNERLSQDNLELGIKIAAHVLLDLCT